MGVLACADMRAGSCGQQVMTLLAARRSGVWRRAVGPFRLSRGWGDCCVALVAVGMPGCGVVAGGGGVAAGVAIPGC